MDLVNFFAKNIKNNRGAEGVFTNTANKSGVKWY